MIVSASYRTDVPAFYGEWFERRLNAGHVHVANPYGGRPYRIDLRPEAVDGFVFWTRNLAPFEPCLDRVALTGWPFVVQFTITGYPRALDVSTPGADQAIASIERTVGRFGVGSVIWRYDPIVHTSLTPADWHRATVARLADALEGLVDEMTVSIATIYRKTARNLDAAAKRHGFAWFPWEEAEARRLVAELAEIVERRGMTLTACAQPWLGVAEARCIDAARLSRLAGRTVTAREKGNRPGCRCAASRDIGAYDTCPHGCAYCYAVASPTVAKRRFRAHDPAGETLRGSLEAGP